MYYKELKQSLPSVEIQEDAKNAWERRMKSKGAKTFAKDTPTDRFTHAYAHDATSKPGDKKVKSKVGSFDHVTMRGINESTLIHHDADDHNSKTKYTAIKHHGKDGNGSDVYTGIHPNGHQSVLVTKGGKMLAKSVAVEKTRAAAEDKANKAVSSKKTHYWDTPGDSWHNLHRTSAMSGDKVVVESLDELAEGGPFGRPVKKPRFGSIAWEIAQGRKKSASEPDYKIKDDKVGNAKVKKDTKEATQMKSFAEYTQIAEEFSRLDLEVGDFVVPNIGPHAGEVHYVSDLLESGRVVIELSEGESSYADDMVSCSRFSLVKLDSIDEGWTRENKNSQEKTNRSRVGQRVTTPKGPGTIEVERKRPTFSRLVPFAHEITVKHDSGETSTHPVKHVKMVKESNELDENSPFDWKSTKSSIDWKAAMSKDKFAAPKHEDDGVTRHKQGDKPKFKAPKKSVGRPDGAYGSYKIDRGARDGDDYKAALSAKVRAAKADGFAARNTFKELMNHAIKQRQAELDHPNYRKN